jgi:hypothetical protein
MAPKTPADTRQRIKSVKRFLLICLFISLAAGMYGFQASFAILPGRSEWVRILGRLGFALLSGFCATMLFTLFFAVTDILTRTRTRLKEHMPSVPDRDSQ